MSLPRANILRHLRFDVVSSVFKSLLLQPVKPMGLLVNGQWVGDDQSPPNLSPRYRNKLDTAEFPFDAEKEPGRYHLYASPSCPFAQRSVLARSYYKLENAIGLSLVDPVNTDQSWSFNSTKYPNVGDKVLSKKHLKDVYVEADPEYTGRVTVPLLIDTKPGNHSLGGNGKVRIISAESADLVDEFEKVSKLPNSVPSQLNVGPNLIGAVIQGAKAEDEDTKEERLSQLRDEFAKLDAELTSKPYLGGNEIANVDLKVFPFLVQVETLSQIVFKDSPRVSDFKHLRAYAHRVYENPSIKNNVHLDQTRAAMFKMMLRLNVPTVRNESEVKDPEWFET